MHIIKYHQLKHIDHHASFNSLTKHQNTRWRPPQLLTQHSPFPSSHLFWYFKWCPWSCKDLEQRRNFTSDRRIRSNDKIYTAGQITKIEVKKMQNKRKTKRKTLAHKQPHNRTRCRQGNHSQKGKRVCNSKWIKDSPGNPMVSPPPKTFWQINIAGCPIGNWTEKLEKDIPGHGDAALHSMSTTAERKSGEVFSVSVM